MYYSLQRTLEIMHERSVKHVNLSLSNVRNLCNVRENAMIPDMVFITAIFKARHAQGEVDMK